MSNRLLFVLVVFFCSNVVLSQENKNCLWGTASEITSYQKPYSPLLGPRDIPVVATESSKSSPSDPTKTAISPETAITVVSSDGSSYSYYYRDVVQYRRFVEYRWVFEPKEEVVTEYSPVFNPCFGRYESTPVQKTIVAPFPSWHEKAFYRDEPTRVRQKIVILGTPANASATPAPNPEAASTVFRMEVVE